MIAEIDFQMARESYLVWVQPNDLSPIRSQIIQKVFFSSKSSLKMNIKITGPVQQISPLQEVRTLTLKWTGSINSTKIDLAFVVNEQFYSIEKKT